MLSPGLRLSQRPSAFLTHSVVICVHMVCEGQEQAATKERKGPRTGTRGAGRETMLDTEAFREFKKGIDRIKLQNPNKALRHIRRAVELENHHPFYLSHLGLVLAQAEHKQHKAEEIYVSAFEV